MRLNLSPCMVRETRCHCSSHKLCVQAPKRHNGASETERRIHRIHVTYISCLWEDGTGDPALSLLLAAVLVRGSWGVWVFSWLSRISRSSLRKPFSRDEIPSQTKSKRRLCSATPLDIDAVWNFILLARLWIRSPKDIIELCTCRSWRCKDAWWVSCANERFWFSSLKWVSMTAKGPVRSTGNSSILFFFLKLRSACGTGSGLNSERKWKNKETFFLSTFSWGLGGLSTVSDLDFQKFTSWSIAECRGTFILGCKKFPRAVVKAKRQKSETTGSKNIRHNVFFVSMALAMRKLLWSRISSKLQVSKEKSLWMSWSNDLVQNLQYSQQETPMSWV